MTREEIIKEIKAHLDETYNIGFHEDAWKIILEALEQEPTTKESLVVAENATSEKTEWIPVSERLPKESGEYFVTVIDEDVETYKHTGIAWYAHPKDYDVEEGDWRELMTDEKVIAWCKLPKPYQSEVSE